MDDDLLTNIGLMLTQVRYARRALEDIERSTARYAGFAFASALSAGPAFGAPPMLDGALKVRTRLLCGDARLQTHALALESPLDFLFNSFAGAQRKGTDRGGCGHLGCRAHVAIL